MIQTPGDPNYGHGPNASQLTSPSGGPPPFGPTGGSGGSTKGSSGASGSVVSLIRFNGFYYNFGAGEARYRRGKQIVACTLVKLCIILVKTKNSERGLLQIHQVLE